MGSNDEDDQVVDFVHDSTFVLISLGLRQHKLAGNLDDN